ncbi:hypothetical protein LJC45_04375 [Alistipes sp. OttesenSCG-928-B03]|nr:hypothetical protein [Alistipes sp. OttesenSCG-928-B03]
MRTITSEQMAKIDPIILILMKFEEENRRKKTQDEKIKKGISRAKAKAKIKQ